MKTGGLTPTCSQSVYMATQYVKLQAERKVERQQASWSVYGFASGVMKVCQLCLQGCCRI